VPVRLGAFQATATQQGSTMWACSGLPRFEERGARVTSFGLAAGDGGLFAQLRSLTSQPISRASQPPAAAGSQVCYAKKRTIL
jgi:hypothetical protein